MTRKEKTIVWRRSGDIAKKAIRYYEHLQEYGVEPNEETLEIVRYQKLLFGRLNAKMFFRKENLLLYIAFYESFSEGKSWSSVDVALDYLNTDKPETSPFMNRPSLEEYDFSDDFPVVMHALSMLDVYVDNQLEHWKEEVKSRSKKFEVRQQFLEKEL